MKKTLAADPPDALRARIHLESALIADYQGEYRRALDHNQLSLSLFETLDDLTYIAKVLKNTGIAHTCAFERGQIGKDGLTEALTCHERALAICQALGNEQLAATVELELGTVYKSLGQWQEALQRYKARSEKCRRFGRQRSLALTLNNIGEVHFHLGQWEQSAECYKESIQILHGLPNADPYEEADVQANLSLTYHAQGNIEAALATSDQAIALVETIRNPLKSETARIGFFGTRIRIYDERIRLEIERGARSDAALTMLERAKSRTFIELLASRTDSIPLKGDHFPTTEQDSLYQVNPLTAAQIQSRLPTDTLLLEYFVTDGRACVFVITRDRLTVIELDPNLHSLLKRLFVAGRQRPARLVPDNNGRLHYPWSLPTLYRLLLMPVADKLKGWSRLCIIPHGPLHYVPFHALMTQAPNQPCYLVETKAAGQEIIYAPSATVLLDYCRAKPTGSGKGGLVLSYGRNLPHVNREGKMVSNILGGRLYVDAGATTEVVSRDGPKYPILHFACHGIFDAASPLASGLDLFDGRLQVGHILEKIHLQADLVTLSGCETGQNQLNRGDELIGLVRAFIFAGTPSVLVTLWQTDDLSTRILMERFYKELAAGLSPGCALRQSQLFLLRVPAVDIWKILRTEGVPPKAATKQIKRLLAASGFSQHEMPGSQPIFSHPYYWAPFILVGDRLKG